MTDPNAAPMLQICVQDDPIDGGYLAWIFHDPAIASQGETEREAVTNVIDAYYEAIGS
jgi:predicted RNase H-like HicB family nuclease